MLRLLWEGIALVTMLIASFNSFVETENCIFILLLLFYSIAVVVLVSADCMDNPFFFGNIGLFFVDIFAEKTWKTVGVIHSFPLIPEILNISKDFLEDSVDKSNKSLYRS